MYLKRKIYDKLMQWKMENDLTLEVTGARQVGKTYILNKFADENFKNKIYINMLEDSGAEFLACLAAARKWKPGEERPERPIQKALSLFSKSFRDDVDTVVLIDEIQESAAVYNLAREFTRKFACRFIITGSYLGRVLDKEFKFSAGDLTSLRMESLTFEEFVEAFGKSNILGNMDLYGDAKEEDHRAMRELFGLYIKIGGYPAVVTEYRQSRSVQKCREKLEDVIRLFCSESVRYFADILDVAVYDNLFCSISRILVREKKGLDMDNLNGSLQKLVVNDYDSNISKAVCNRALNWLQSAGILDYAGKISECKILDFKARSRCYFTDLGLTNYFLLKIGADEASITGLLHENHVYLELRRRMERLNEMALETPAFATYKNGEIDFFVKSLVRGAKQYAVEVKSGKNPASTGHKALEDKKVDYLLLLKGNTKGGNANPIFTVPIYLFSKFQFHD